MPSVLEAQHARASILWAGLNPENLCMHVRVGETVRCVWFPSPTVSGDKNDFATLTPVQLAAFACNYTLDLDELCELQEAFQATL